MEYLDYLDYLRYVPPRGLRRQLERNPFDDLTEDEFKTRYRLTMQSSQELIRLLQNRLGEVDARAPHGIPAWKQVLIALRFFAVGTFHRETGDLLGVSKSSACKIVHRVALAICEEMRREYIVFPTGDRAAEIKNVFFDRYGFPGVLGVVDGTHIPIACPATHDKEEYRCRKGFYSINVMAACGPDLEITNIVARWKGSTHDSRVFQNSSLYARFEENEMGGVLIGDAGYGCNRFMITPLANPTTPPQRRFNIALKRTRTRIEQCFGQLKSRFRCLHSGNMLRFKPRRCCIVIVACAVLHNFTKRRGDEWELDDDDDDVSDDEEERPRRRREDAEGRNAIIERHFT